MSESQDTVVDTSISTEAPAVETTPAPTPAAEPAPAATETPLPKTSMDALTEVIDKVQKKAAAAKETPAVAAPATAVPAAAAYTPNFKVSAYGKEREIPEVLRPLIKDADSEKTIKEICAKAFGLDEMKPLKDQYLKERDAFGQENQVYKSTLESLRSDYQRNDLDSFFQKLNIPVEKILEFAIKKAQYLELPPEQRAQIDNQRQVELRARNLEAQNQDLTANMQRQLATAKQEQLAYVMARPDISAVAQSFDAQAKNPGAFRQLVVSRGELEWHRSGGKIDLTPQQAIDLVMKDYGIRAGTVAPAAPTSAVVAPAPAGTSTAPKTSIIPNVQGKTTSPLRPKPKSIAEIEKITKEKYG